MLRLYLGHFESESEDAQINFAEDAEQAGKALIKFRDIIEDENTRIVRGIEVLAATLETSPSKLFTKTERLFTSLGEKLSASVDDYTDQINRSQKKYEEYYRIHVTSWFCCCLDVFVVPSNNVGQKNETFLILFPLYLEPNTTSALYFLKGINKLS